MSDNTSTKTPSWSTSQIRLRNTSQEFIPQQYSNNTCNAYNNNQMNTIKHSASDNVNYQHRSNSSSYDMPHNISTLFPVSQSIDSMNNPLYNETHQFQYNQQHQQFSDYDCHMNQQSQSDAGSDIQNTINSSTNQQDIYSTQLYKTELCKSYTDTNYCRYGLKCRFAHGMIELRPIARHKKYKTERCKNYEETGICPYGPRCRFIHEQDEISSWASSEPQRIMYNNNQQPSYINSKPQPQYTNSPVRSMSSTPSHSHINTQQYNDIFNMNNAYTSPISTIRSQPVSATISPAIMPASYHSSTNISSSVGPRAYTGQSHSMT